MDQIEFGKRVTLIREKVLKMNQTDFANKLGTYQPIISQLEKGRGGGTLTLILDLVNLLNKNNFQGHMLFGEDFDVNLLSKNIQVGNQDLLKTISQLKQLATSLNLQVQKKKSKSK